MKTYRDRLVVFFLAGLVVLLLGWFDSVRYWTVFKVYESVDLSIWQHESLVGFTLYFSDAGDGPAEFIRRPTDTQIVFQKFSFFHLKEEISLRGVVSSIHEDCTIVRVPYWMLVLVYLAMWSVPWFIRAVRGKKRSGPVMES